MNQPKVLVLDIETSPTLAHVWNLWQTNVSLNQIMQAGQVIGVGYKWYGKPTVGFLSDHHHGHEEMVQRAHALLDEADIVVHYNGRSFDIKHLQREFAQAGLQPPSPFKQVDLLLAVKRQFKFQSNKLDFVSKQLGLKGKVSHTGHQLWVDCLNGDPKAWALMARYCRQDVRLTEELYDRLLPWLPNHPHRGLWTGESVSCGSCGSTQLQRRGTAYAKTGAYQRFQCQSCGSWSQSVRRLAGVDVREVAQ